MRRLCAHPRITLTVVSVCGWSRTTSRASRNYFTSCVYRRPRLAGYRTKSQCPQHK
jgi:hypothetical protein